jgi:hypothetical protein
MAAILEQAWLQGKSEDFNRRNDSIGVSGTALVRLIVLAHESTSFIYTTDIHYKILK